MTSTIMTRPGVRAVQAAHNPEYACQRCGHFHSGQCASAAVDEFHRLVADMVRHADAQVPAGRRARRTLQEMAPGYERQPILTLHRPTMADDACVLCGRWNCTGTDCPPNSAVPAPAPVTSGGGMQCESCGAWLGAAPAATVQPGRPTAWRCAACSALGL
ncbi:hypothetical protein ACTWJ8_40300 (plasmid) [Streptomyces sp. SDT5-1]|uniref:hypothetical protein n=1 Tax=Streptomyces sp. SDT5-1 TaxID=3406418 RepID=UPI003FD25539